MNELPRTITDLLSGINNEDDQNKLFVLTGCFNLYMEAIRRCQGRVYFNTGDIRAILEMAYTMCVEPPEQVPTAKVSIEDRAPTKTEETMLEEGRVPEVGQRRAV